MDYLPWLFAGFIGGLCVAWVLFRIARGFARRRRRRLFLTIMLISAIVILTGVLYGRN